MQPSDESVSLDPTEKIMKGSRQVRSFFFVFFSFFSQFGSDHVKGVVTASPRGCLCTTSLLRERERERESDRNIHCVVIIRMHLWEVSGVRGRGSGEGAVRPVEGGVGLVAAPAVHVFRVSVDAVAALHLCDGRGRVGGGAQRVRVVPHAAAQLQVVLVPVAPQHRLDLARDTAQSLSVPFTLRYHAHCQGRFARLRLRG